MRYRPLGKSGIDVSVVGLGTWAIGGREWGRVDDGDSVKAVRRALDVGVTLFDTAPIYGGGHAEEVLGRALEADRKQVVVATKCGPVEAPGRGLTIDLSSAGIRRQCEASLRRLKTDWVDLLQVHWSDPAWPVEDAVRAIEDLVTAGKVRAVGVSNFTPDELRRAAGAAKVASIQPPYSLVRRKVEKEVLPFCREAGIGVIAYEPLARGLLTGKFDERPRLDPGDIRLGDPRFRGNSLRRHLDAVEDLSTLARRNGVSPGHLAIAWVVSQPGVTSAICGAKTAAQVVANAHAADEDLDPETARRAAEIVAGVADISGDDQED
jgi:aryl-alcohol dehydrogenase-like predicted oxidoreductase